MIEVGEYVRLESGIHNGIRKIVGRDEDDHLLIDISFTGARWLTFTEEAEIEKHSKNIIDLIEVGDIIVTKHPAFEKTYYEHIWSEEYLEHIKEFLKEKSLILKSIVTHEQFKSIEYRLEA